MSKVYKGTRPDRVIGAILENYEVDKNKGSVAPVEDETNSKLIREAIIYDDLGCSSELFENFGRAIGNFGVRDNLLTENAAFDIKSSIFKDLSLTETTSILAIAKEANNKNWELFNKAMVLAEAAFDAMEKEFSEDAADRVKRLSYELANNPRITEAVTKVKAGN